jgi:hypothetical protein
MGNIRAFTSKLKDRKKKVDYAKQREIAESTRSITITTPAYVPGPISRSTTSGYQGMFQQSSYPATSTRERYSESYSQQRGQPQQFASRQNDDIIFKEESNSNNQPSVRKTPLYVLLMRVHTGVTIVIATCYVSRRKPAITNGAASIIIYTNVELRDTDEFVFIEKFQIDEDHYKPDQFLDIKREPEPEKYLHKIYFDTWYGPPIDPNPNQEGFYVKGVNAVTYKKTDHVPVLLGRNNSFENTEELKAVYQGEYYVVRLVTITGLQIMEYYTPAMFKEFLKEKTIF